MMSNVSRIAGSTTTQTPQNSAAEVEGAPETPQTSSGSSTNTEQNSMQTNGTLERDPSAMMAEQRLTGFVREMQVRGSQSAPDGALNLSSNRLSDIVSSARQSGMSQTEATRLQDQLSHLNPQTLRSELSFLQRHVVNTPNACRALRTYVALRDLPDPNHRLSPDLLHTLTRGVAERRTSARVGAEGILGQEQAIHAAHAMIEMPQGDYQRITRVLNGAGQRNGRTVEGSDPQAERALILKAVGARQTEFRNTDPINQIALWSGTTRDVEQFARQIRGSQRDDLIRRSTVLDLNTDGNSDALQQRFVDSCTPTTAQMARAEADPIYARQLHQEAMDSPVRNTRRSETAREQRQQLNRQHPFYLPGQGMIGPGYGNILNDLASTATNNNYVRNNIENTPQDRRDALNRIDAALRRGVDVPISVIWDSHASAHALLVTDVRGNGNDRRYLVNDPATGQTNWISAQNIINGHTDFMAGIGRLRAVFE